MATVGQGSPLQTIEYKATPFEVMNYAPQILAQKHENLYNQYDALGAAMPSNIPDEAVADVQAYTKGLDEAVQDLSKSGYSFGMRNKLSELRRGYVEKIKPIEDYNKTKAEFEQLNMKAKMNPDLIAIGKMPTYGEYVQGNRSYDFNVVSGSEYEKYGLSKATQSATKAFVQDVGNGMQATGFRDNYHGMDAEEIKSAIMKDPDITKKLMTDGITDPQYANEAIDRIVKGIMSRPPVQSISQKPVPAKDKVTSGGKTPSPSDFTLKGGAVVDIAAIGGKTFTYKEGFQIMSDPNAPVETRQAAQRDLVRKEKAVLESKNPELINEYQKVMAATPRYDQSISTELSNAGLSHESIQTFEANLNNIINEFADKSFVGKSIAGLGDTSGYILDQLVNINPKLKTDLNKLDRDSRSKIAKSIQQSINNTLKWNDQMESLSDKIPNNTVASVDMYSSLSQETHSKVKTTVTNFLNDYDVSFENVSQVKDGELNDITKSKEKNKEIWDNMRLNGEIKNISVSAPSGPNDIPGFAEIEGTYDDKAYKVRVVPNEADQFNFYRGLSQATGQTQLLIDAIDRYTSKDLDIANGSLPVSYFKLGNELDKIDSNLKNDEVIRGFLDAKVIRAADGNFKLLMNGNYSEGVTKISTLYSYIESLVFNRVKDLQ